MTLPWYVTRRFFVTFLRVLGIVLALVFMVEFVEHLRKYSDETDSFGDILQLTLLRLPSSIDRALSLIVLLSSLTLFVTFARSSEMVIFRASGVSALRLVFVPVGIAILLGFFAIGVLNPIIAGTSRQYDVMRAEISNSGVSLSSISEGGLWLRQATGQADTVIQARRANPDGTVLFDTTFHVFAKDGRLDSVLHASRAVLRGQQWELSDVRSWSNAKDVQNVANVVERSDFRSFETNLTSEQILDSFAPPETISFWAMPLFIAQMENSGFTATRHRQYLQSTLATPVVFAAMVLIGASLTMRHARFGNVGIMVLAAVLAGFALYIFRNLSASLGAAGEIPVLIAAWAPPTAAILLVIGLLLHIEDG